MEKTLTLLRQKYRVAALVGDLATENDAARLARSRAPVKHISTGTMCHLEAAMVETALGRMGPQRISIFFLSKTSGIWFAPRPTTWGENLRLVLISVTEGEDKPLKYPTIFNSADVAIVTKMDLAYGCGIRLGIRILQHPGCSPRHAGLKVSAKTGEGIDEYLSFLTTRLEELRSAASV